MATSSYCAHCLTTFGDDPPRCPNLGCSAERPDGGWGAVLGPGDLLDRHYLVERCLAVGGAGLTYLAREVDGDGRPTGPKLAVKVLYRARASGPFLRRLANEAQILQELAHGNIVQCVGFVQRTGTEPYLVTLFEEGGSLAQHVDRVGPLPPRVAAGVLRQVLLALDVAHQRGVVHRDLKPDNVLLSEAVPAGEIPHVRVGDFGIAKVTGGLTSRLTQLGAFVGTPEYAAPEQFEGRGSTAATDVFAAGGLLYAMLTGQPPVRFSQRQDLEGSYDELLEQVPPRLDPSAVTGATLEELALLQEVLQHTMVVRPDDRWTVHQVLARLTPLLEVSAKGRHTLAMSSDSAPGRVLSPTSVPLEDPSLTFSIDPTGEEPRPLPPPHAAAAPPETPPVPPEPTYAPSAPPEPTARRSGLAGCMGVGVGLGLLSAAGTAAVAALLLVAAWGLGWLDGGEIALAPVTLDEEVPSAWVQAPTMLGLGEKASQIRLQIQDEVDEAGAAIGKRCGARGPAVAELLVDPQGRVHEARLHPSWVAADRGDCVEEELRDLRFDVRVRRTSIARVAFSLGD